LPEEMHKLRTKKSRWEKKHPESQERLMKADMWIQRISHISQAGLFITALLTIYFTVIPLYTKAALEEQIAKKEIDLNNLENQLKERYAEVRIYTVQSFVRYSGAQCSGLFIGPATVGEHTEGSADRNEIFEIDVESCLWGELDKSEGISKLEHQDQQIIRNNIFKAIRALKPIKSKALEEYQNFRSRAEKNPEILGPMKPNYTDKFLYAIPMPDDQRKEILHESQILEKRDEIAHEYSEKIRSEILQIIPKEWKN
jgi:hypothetical protein